MRQLLLNNSGAIVARMPRPVVGHGEVLIQVKYSMISVGTELAGLRQNHEQAPQSTLDKAKNYSSLARTYLGKAIRNPRKAASKAKQIAKRVAPKRSVKSAPAEIVSLGALKWQKVGAQEMSAQENALRFVTDTSECGYQVMSGKISVPAGHSPMIELSGELLDGSVSIGLLDDAQTQWLDSKILNAGRLDERIVFKANDSESITVVISNTQAHQSKLDLESIQVNLMPPEKNGLPHTEMADQGWNVGYSAAGEVIAVGTGIHDIQVGDLVACAGAGKANHADYVVVPRNLVCPVPEGCSLQAAASTTIGTIALQGVRRANPTLGETVVVLGLGLLGQLTVQMLVANGVNVIGLDLDEKRVERAMKHGMMAGSHNPDELAKLVRNHTNGFGADRTIITAATKSSIVINSAMQLTRRKGTVVIVGDIGMELQRADFYKKEIDLLMSTSYGPGRYDNDYELDGHDYPLAYVRWTSNRNMHAYMDLIAKHRLDVDALIDKVVPISQAPEVYAELAKNQTQDLLGVVMEYDKDSRVLPQASEANSIILNGHRKAHTNKINYALVGAGAFGTCMLVPQLDKLADNFFLKGVISRDTTRGGNFARGRELEVLSCDLDDALSRDDIHMVVIATRHCDHAKQVIAALKAGKHVFVEKPIALTWEELEQIHEMYQSLDHKPVLMVGFNRRFSPAMQALSKALANRQSPLIINYRLNGGYIAPDHWIQDAQGGGRNIGEACHMYDCFRFLANSPIANIHAQAIHPGQLPYLRNDNFVATTQYQDGSVGNLIYTALGPKQGLPKERIEVFCDGEAYIIDDFKTLTKCSSGEVLWSGEVDKGHFNELKALGEAIKAGSNAPIAFEDIMETSAVAIRIEDLIFTRDDIDDE